MTPPVDITPKRCSHGLKGSKENLVIAGNIIAVDLALATPPFDSIKFGASVVAPTAKNSGTGL